MLPAPTPFNEAERLASLRKMLLLSTPDEEAFDRVTRTAQRLFNVPIALVSLVDDSRQWFKSCIGLPVRETGRDVSFCGHAIMHDEILVVENTALDPRFFDNPLVSGAPHVAFYAGRPLHNAERHRVGTLCVIDRKPRAFGPADRLALNDLGHWVEHIFYNRELGEAEKAMLGELDEARRAGLLDPRMNIWNRGAAMQMLEREAWRALRNHSPLSVLIVDIDDFAQVGELYGQPAADAVQSEFAKRLRSLIRPYDSIGRGGDDEFVVILPDTDAVQAMQIARRLSQAAAAAPFLAADAAIALSASIGCYTATFVDATPTHTELLQRAESALQQARRNGRGGVVAAP